PRCGKTSCFMIPNVLGARGPVISTSTKPDVLEATLDHRSAMGRCWLLDPFNEVRAPAGVTSLRWSPVPLCADWTTAQLVCTALADAAGIGGGASDPHWRAQALTMLDVLMHAAAVGGMGVDAVTQWVNRRDLGPARAILAGRGEPIASEVMVGLSTLNGRELASVFSTASDAVAAYRTRQALESATDPNLAAAELVGSTDTIYVCASSEVQALVAPTVVMLVGRAVAAAYARSRAVGAGVGEPLLLALDEVANIAPLKDLPDILSEGASQGVLVAASFQDLSQARVRWGAAADGFLTKFGGKLVFGGISQPESLKAISMLCGEAEVPVRTVSCTVQSAQRGRRGGGQSVTTTWSTRRQAVLSPADVSQGAPGHALYVEGRSPPSWMPLTHWTEVFALEAARTLPAIPERPRRRLGRSVRSVGLER
ncbi:MAG: type IV secretory system conjugative DNA transfer family protein, partial [Acidimicrobiales bacterium]